MCQRPQLLHTLGSNITHILSMPQVGSLPRVPLKCKSSPQKLIFSLIILTHNCSSVTNVSIARPYRSVSSLINCMYHPPFLLSSCKTLFFLHSDLPPNFSVCVSGQGHLTQSPGSLFLFVHHESPVPHYSNPAISPVSKPYLCIISFGTPFLSC